MLKISNLITLPLRYFEFLFNKVHPLWCTFAITENCNAQCEYCQYWREKHPELSTQDILKVIHKLKELGIVSVVFSGGECMLRTDLAEVVAYTTSLGLQSSLVTNGIIGKEKLFHELMAAGLRGIAFSLDGSTAAIHEGFRKNCSFDKLKSSIQKALEVRKKNQFSTYIATTTVVNRTNIHDLQNIYQLRKSLGADKNYFQPIWDFMHGESSSNQFDFNGMEMEDLQKVAEDLMSIPEGNLNQYYQIFPHLYKNFSWVPKKYQCFAARAFVYVDSRGDLFPCSPLADKEPLGSLLDEDVPKLLSRTNLKDRILEYKNFRCGGCTLACYMEKNVVLSSLYNPIGLFKRIRYQP